MISILLLESLSSEAVETGLEVAKSFMVGDALVVVSERVSIYLRLVTSDLLSNMCNYKIAQLHIPTQRSSF